MSIMNENDVFITLISCLNWLVELSSDVIQSVIRQLQLYLSVLFYVPKLAIDM